MSAQTSPNSKYVAVPLEVPRDPSAYRSTLHFGQRLRERVPQPLRDRVVSECIGMGVCSGVSPPLDTDRDVHQWFAFDHVVGGVEWTVIVGIVLEAFRDNDKKHLAVTVYGNEGEDQ